MTEPNVNIHDFGARGAAAYIDNLLPKPAFDALADFAESARTAPVTYDDPKGVWQDNAPYNPFQSRTIVWPNDDTYLPLLKSLPDIDVYPMGTPVDDALRAIRRSTVEYELLGDAPSSSAGAIASINRYGPGSRLMWHGDDDGYVGAFTYYIHRNWNANDGGQFLYQAGRSSEGYEGCFITPRPNRLVIVRPPLPHAVAPIVATPGNDRIALTGFFISFQKAEYLIKLHALA